MYPSTCGLIFAECRDFKIARYSVVCAIFSACATFTCTGIAGGAPPAAGSPADVFPQPAAKVAASAIKAQFATCSSFCFLMYLVSAVCKPSICGHNSLRVSTKFTTPFHIGQSDRTPASWLDARQGNALLRAIVSHLARSSDPRTLALYASQTLPLTPPS